MNIRRTNWGVCTYNLLLQRFGDAVCFFRASNRIIALLGVAKVPDNVCIVEYVDEPLWKQSMSLQMGIPPQKKISRRSYRTYEIKNPQNYHFEVFEMSY